MRINVATREVTCKVVYYGPGMSGKTTNLKVIHDRAPSHSVGELLTLDTHSERTLHFDLLPMDFGAINGYSVRFEFFTVPGQSYYAATRRLVLEGADGVVFVADSRREALDENIDSMNDLLDNLRHHQLPEDLPVVMQYNKQDLSTALNPEQLDPLLNIRRWPRFTAVATAGEGVLETMKNVAELVIDRLKQSGDLPAAGAGAPAAAGPAPAPNRTWLITCYRCQNMLETTNAKKGDHFTCGACGTPLEVMELERGLTRAPAQQAAAAPAGPAAGAPPEDTNYSMQAIPQDRSGALGIPSGGQPAVPQGSATPFEIEGFDVLAMLDDTVQGRRFRIRERTTNARYRALVISPTLARQPGYLQQVEPYARLASQVKHPHLLPLASLRQGRESPVLLSNDPTDYESLSHVLARRRTLAPPHAVGILRQLSLALEEASRHGVTHGWLRPDVILVNAEGNLLLDEIGIAKNHRYLVRELSGASAATEYYLAPEFLNDETRGDVRSDVFMLGALLFRMITGEGLVTGYSAHEALHKVVATGCRALRTAQPSISRDLDGFASRMVATERRDRFQDYREIIDQLDRFGGGAKRATLRLTQTIGSGGGGGGTGTMMRPSTAATRATGTAGMRSSTASIRPSTASVRPGTAGQSRSRPGGGNSEVNYAPARARKPESSGIGWVILLLVLVGLAGGGWLLYEKNQHPLQSAVGLSHSTPDPLPSSNPTVIAPTTAIQPVPRPTPPAVVPVTSPAPTTNPSPTTGPLNSTIGPAGPRIKDPTNRGDLLFEISSLERAERFQAAMAACERLADQEERQTRVVDVVAHHENRRKEIEAKVRAEGTMAKVKELLTPAQNVWGMPGDDDWARAQLADAEKRIGALPTPTPTATTSPLPTPVADPGPGAAAQANLTATAVDVDAQVDQALQKLLPALADQPLSTLPKDSAEAQAIRRKIDVWNSRAEVLTAVLRERAPKLRVTSPTDNALWDVAGAESGGLLVTSPAGSTTRLDWNQVSAKDLGRICQEAAGFKDSRPREHALAAVMLCLAGDTTLASVQLIKAKGVLDEPLARDLDMLITLRRQRDNSDLLKRARAAAAASNPKLLADYIEQLKRPDRAALPLVASDLPRLEETLKRLLEGKTAGGDAQVKDHLTFDNASDLLSFPTRDGAWQVAGGMLSASGGNAGLVRKDLGNAKSLNLIFQCGANRGAMTVNFRGVRVLVDLSRNSILISSKEQELKPAEFTVMPRTSQSLYMQLRGGAGNTVGQMSIELNNGVKIFDLRAGALSDQLSINLDTGANVSFDEITVTRDTGKVAVDPAADLARQENLRKIGLEPIGAARLDPPMIILPPAGNGPHSGVALAIRDTINSVTFEVKGKGKLRIQLGKLGTGDGQWVEIDMPKDPESVVRYTVGWGGGVFSIKTGDGAVVSETKLVDQHSHLIILAMQEATIMTTPRPNRQ